MNTEPKLVILLHGDTRVFRRSSSCSIDRSLAALNPCFSFYFLFQIRFFFPLVCFYCCFSTIWFDLMDFLFCFLFSPLNWFLLAFPLLFLCSLFLPNYSETFSPSSNCSFIFLSNVFAILPIGRFLFPKSPSESLSVKVYWPLNQSEDFSLLILFFCFAEKKKLLFSASVRKMSGEMSDKASE